MKLKILAALLAMGLMAAGARAQIAPYAMFSLEHYSGPGVDTSLTQSGSMTPLGGTFGIYDDMLKAGPVKVGADARLIIANSGNSTQYGNKLSGFLTGGRIDANAVVLPFRPYAQVELGLIGSNYGTQASRRTQFAYQLQLGGDFTLIPHVGARVEYGVGQEVSGGVNHTLQSFGAGIVVRL